VRGSIGILFTAILATQAPGAVADAYRTGNPGSAYPPSCISGPLRSLDLTADHVVQFFSEVVWLEVAQKIQSNDPLANLGQVQLDMYRIACSEPGRSVVLAEFRLPREWVDPRNAVLLLPWLGGNTGFDPYPFAWRPEANSWGLNQGQLQYTNTAFGDFTGGWDDPRYFSWRYVLEVPPPGGIAGRSDGPKYYNEEQAILMYTSDGEHFMTVVLPATESVITSRPELPLSGRLTGHWVEEGSADQGLLITFNSLPHAGELPALAEETPLTVFFSWFTFDAQGDPLWLTGAASFAPGTSEVVVSIEAVQEGVFLGDAPARRSTVGSARLRAIECNRLEFEYELDALGLGGDVMYLQRMAALEIADFPCRDHWALQESIDPPDSNQQ